MDRLDRIESPARVSVGLEEGADGAVTAHALDLPGCAASGASPHEAMAAFERELVGWLRFLAAVGEPVPSTERELEIAVDEWLRTDAQVDEGESTALFDADLEPLSQEEAERGVRLLGDLRGRLLVRFPRRAQGELDATTPAGIPVRLVLEELARAQWWTLSRLGATPMAGAPDHTVARLDTAMALAVQQLTTLPDDARDRVLEIDGEEWTPRKVLRRLLWLEWTLGRTAERVLARDAG